MKKKDVINLIRSHVERNEVAFRNTAYAIANAFREMGDTELAEYVVSLMSDVNAFQPQEKESPKMSFVEQVKLDGASLLLPTVIQQDIIGLSNAIERAVGIHKIIFQGAPGTGKTEAVKMVASMTHKELFAVNFAFLIDSKLGQTAKNMIALFDEFRSLIHPENVIILFDEIDSLALDRNNPNDIREMGRVTSMLLKELDALNENITLIATTNLYAAFDKAVTRRFDAVISFDRYTMEDLIAVGLDYIETMYRKFPFHRNSRLFDKILRDMKPVLSPGELKNAIKTSMAFSDKNEEFDYLRRLFLSVVNKKENDLQSMKERGYSLRDIEILLGVSKSQASRALQ